MRLTLAKTERVVAVKSHVAAAGLQAPNWFVADQDTTDFVVVAGYLVAMVVSVASCRGPRLAAELAAD